MKKLHLLVIKSFLGPFILTFFIVLFILLMQFLWRYIDDLVGKGLNFSIIMELLLYTSASLISMALPLSILMSSLMTFGSLGEYYELTAIKSSGVSLQRLMRPVIIFVILISIAAFFFSNNVLPITNLKSKTLLTDVRRQKPELSIDVGEFYNGIENYSIRISSKNPKTNILYGLTIYDHTNRKGNSVVVIADSGQMKMTADEKYLIFTLWNGYNYVDLEEDNKRFRSYPFRKDKYREQEILISLESFDFKRTDESLFKNRAQMLNLKQLDSEIDTLGKSLQLVNDRFQQQLISTKFFHARQPRSVNRKRDSILQAERKLKISLSSDSIFSTSSYKDKTSIMMDAISRAQSAQGYIVQRIRELKDRKENVRKYEVEWHRKFTLSFACLIFLLIGAPFGAIIRKGGLGMPTVISVLLFIVYYIISLLGEKFARESVTTSFQGMWIASAILFLAGIFITYKATTDSQLFNIEAYVLFFQKLFRTNVKMKSQLSKLDKNIYYSDIDPDKLIHALKSISEKARECIYELNQSYIQLCVKFITGGGGIFLSQNPVIKRFLDSYNDVFIYLNSSQLRDVKEYLQKVDSFPLIRINRKKHLLRLIVFLTLTGAAILFFIKDANTQLLLFGLLFLFISIMPVIKIKRMKNNIESVISISKSLVVFLENPLLKKNLKGIDENSNSKS